MAQKGGALILREDFHRHGSVQVKEHIDVEETALYSVEICGFNRQNGAVALTQF